MISAALRPAQSKPGTFSRMRLTSSDKVIRVAEQAVRLLIEAYAAPEENVVLMGFGAHSRESRGSPPN